MFAADQGARIAGRRVEDWIRRAPKITGEDGSGAALAQRIFYPIPNTQERLRRLNDAEKRSWTPLVGCVARENLYYSWATFTWLGRSVHCNCGRPELWVFPPNA